MFLSDTHLEGSCRLWQGASRSAGYSWGSEQRWRYRWDTPQTLPLQCNIVAPHGLEGPRERTNSSDRANVDTVLNDTHTVLFNLAMSEEPELQVTINLRSCLQSYQCVCVSAPQPSCGSRWTAGPGRNALSWRGPWSHPQWARAVRRGKSLLPAGSTRSRKWSTRRPARSTSLAEGLTERDRVQEELGMDYMTMAGWA